MSVVRAGVVVAALGVAALLDACSDSPGPCLDCPPPPTTGLIVSNPIPTPAATATASAAYTSGGKVVSASGDEVVYVSLTPGTAPSGSSASFRRVGAAQPTTAPMFDGGADPVALSAQAGDSIDVVVTDVHGNQVYRQRLGVAAYRPPVVVRTDPSRSKTDVAINASIVIVFSEPVAAGSLTSSSVQLFQGTTPVAGTVSLLQGSGTAAAFTPSAPLSPNSAYRLVVTQAVRDLDGETLPAPVTVDFATGQSTAGPAASITLSPDSVFITGATYQMTATVRDAEGNILIDQPVTWSTSDPAGLSVSSTGLLTALTGGYYGVTATVNGLTAYAWVYVAAGPAASVSVAPTQGSVGAAGDTIKVTATVRDAAGRLLYYPSVTWTSSDVAVATIAADSSRNTGLAFATVTGVSPGSVTITATSGTASGSASVTVTPPLSIASVTVTPASVTLVVQGRRQLSAVARDANSKVLAGRPIAWTTDNAAAATVDANGLVTAIGLGSAAVTATSEGVSDTAAITVTVVSYASVSAGYIHTCGITTAGAAYCWGQGANPGGGPFGELVPTAVSGGLTFVAVSAGEGHTCGITIGGAAYCWGLNNYGQLGDGTTSDRTSPVAVTDGLSFATVSAAGDHTCAVTTAGAAYCWGANSSGQLGNGTTNPTGGANPSPVAVLGGLSFVMVSAGGVQSMGHTCGVTTVGAAYCWGDNSWGQLGDGTTTNRTNPVAVLGGFSFVVVGAAGYGHTCGVTAGGAAYCWGHNPFGQLGDGTTSDRTSPVAVVGGLSFAAVSAGGYIDFRDHTCGVTTGGAAYCWGDNSVGQLGDGTTTNRATPVAVLGGLGFTGVGAGEGHTCGVTVDGVAYCWGGNSQGQLGTGNVSYSSAPVKVAGQP